MQVFCNQQIFWCFIMECFYATKSMRSRNSETCNGHVNQLTSKEAQDLGIFRNISVCLKHERQEIKRNTANCCFPFKNDVLCSAEKKVCPGRLLRVFLSLNGSHEGNFICIKHLCEADNTSEVVGNPEYVPPKKRQVSS